MAAIVLLVVFAGIALMVHKSRRVRFRKVDSTLNRERGMRLDKMLEEREGDRLSDSQRKVIEENVGLYDWVPEELRGPWEERILVFLESFPFTDMEDGPVTEEMRLLVAAEACLLIVRRSKDDYKQLRRVKFSPRDLSTFGEESKWAGDASRTTVRMGWYWTQNGMEDGEDNYNLTIHEYAHVLDAAHDGKSEASIKLGDYKTTREWLKFAKESYKRLCSLWDRDAHYKEPVIRKYGTTNMAEFFACATEAFFEVLAACNMATFNSETFFSKEFIVFVKTSRCFCA